MLLDIALLEFAKLKDSACQPNDNAKPMGQISTNP